MVSEPGLDERQIAAAVAGGEQWTRNSLSTEPCDRPAAEAAVRRLHRLAGLPDPVVLWAGSPLGGAITDAVLGEPNAADREPALAEFLGPMATVGEYARYLAVLREQLTGLPADRVRPGFERRAHPELVSRPLARVDDRLFRAFRHEDWAWKGSRWVERLPLRLAATLLDHLAPPAAVHDVGFLVTSLAAPDWSRPTELADQVATLRRELAADRVPDPASRAGIRARRWGRNLAFVVAELAAAIPVVGPYVIVPRSTRGQTPVLISAEHGIQIEIRRQALAVAGLPPSAELDALADVLQAVGCWWPQRRVAILVDRPTTLRRDGTGRLHSRTGPAVVYPDGFALYYWRGMQVPPDLVTGDGWAPARILAEPDAEVRRCAIERYGWDRFADGHLTPVGAAVPDPGNPGQWLRLYDLPQDLRMVDGRPARLLVVTNASPDRDGTRRSFGLLVPVDVPDALAAVAATFDLTSAEYASLTRAT